MPIWRRADWKPVVLSRSQGIGARLKYRACPAASVTGLTTFGFWSSSRLTIGVPRVAMPASASANNNSAACRIKTGGISGSSPCTFTTTASSGQLSCVTASAIRSVPDACLLEVITTVASNFWQASRTIKSSVATTTSSAPLCRARAYTCWIIGLPASMSNGLPGKREAAYRAGMTTLNDMQDFQGRHYYQDFSIVIIYRAADLPDVADRLREIPLPRQPPNAGA